MAYKTLKNLQDGVPFPDFNDWFSSVIEEVKPNLIIAIARGAIRLLQLQNINHIISDILILSDSALPFLSDSQIKSKRVLLFDDSVIFGSTLSNIRDYLYRRGAIVSCASYVIDRSNFYGEKEPRSKTNNRLSEYSDIPILAKHHLYPSSIKKHHNKLIRFLLRTPTHYNLDFPTFSLKVVNFSASDIPYIIKQLYETQPNIIKKISDVSSSASSNHGIYRYTILISSLWCNLFPQEDIICRPYSKARLTFAPSLGEIRFTPIPQLVLTEGILYEDIKFSDDILLSLWHRLHPPYQKNDPFYTQSLFRLLTSFVGILIGETIKRKFVSTLLKDFTVDKIELLDDDIKSVIGVTNSQALNEILSFLNNLDKVPGLVTEKINSVDDCQEPINSDLLVKTVKAWNKAPELKPYPGELSYEVLGKVFLTLRAVTDSPECRKINPNVSRLNVGLSYEAIRKLLREECDINLSPEDISLSMDVCVDNGQSVPKVIIQDSTCLRAFYSGEVEDSQETMQFKNAIFEGYSKFMSQKGAHPLSKFDMHKLCATLKDLLPHLPISSKFYTFGKFAMIGQSEGELIPWLTDSNNGPLKFLLEENKISLIPNEGYKFCVASTWDINDSRNFYDSFQFIATAFSKLSNEPKLLISTCRTHKHTYNAIAFEAHSWVNNNNANYSKIFHGIPSSSIDSKKIMPQVISSIYWCTRYISEAWKKHDVFYKKFNKLNEQLKKEFNKQGQPAERFWQYYIEENEDFKLDDVRDLDIEDKFKVLMPIIRLMSFLTSYINRVLIDLGVLSLEELQNMFKSEKTSLEYKEFEWLTMKDSREIAMNYNHYKKKHQKELGPSIVKTELPFNVPNKDNPSVKEWFNSMLDTIQECFYELKNSLNTFCKEYDIHEGDFPYSPDGIKRVSKDGSVEKHLKKIYALTMDIIGSTDSTQTNEFKDGIINIFQQVNQQHPGLYYENTGNDAYVVCSEDPVVLFDLAKEIRFEGDRFKGEQLQGTRKGLSFGSVRIIKSPKGIIRITDYLTPHLLPRAFGILNGVDSYCKDTPISRNSVIGVERTTAEQCAKILNLNLEDEKTTNVDSKHFLGPCYIINL